MKINKISLYNPQLQLFVFTPTVSSWVTYLIWRRTHILYRNFTFSGECV